MCKLCDEVLNNILEIELTGDLRNKKAGASLLLGKPISFVSKYRFIVDMETIKRLKRERICFEYID